MPTHLILRYAQDDKGKLWTTGAGLGRSSRNICEVAAANPSAGRVRHVSCRIPLAGDFMPGTN